MSGYQKLNEESGVWNRKITCIANKSRIKNTKKSVSYTKNTLYESKPHSVVYILIGINRKVGLRLKLVYAPTAILERRKSTNSMRTLPRQ